MQKNEIEKHINFLLSVALYKCENFEDAQDLVQETLLAAVTHISAGKEIIDLKTWLFSVLNRKFFDMLRKKYKLPTICLETIPEPSESIDDFTKFYESNDAEEIRKQIAFLSKLYREIIIRHYFYGESVENIATSLDIPVGTVKSRLWNGREQIKKGFDTTVNFTKQSYEPEVLHVVCSGVQGINGEPYSIANNNPIMQNILIIAYDEPITEADISKAIGIPTAYIEPIIENLVQNELMKGIGSKVYTDFIVFKPNDIVKHIPAQKELIEENFNSFWQSIHKGINKLKKTSTYARLSTRQRAKYEYYFLIHCLDRSIYEAGARIYGGNQIVPDRPNGGKWIAMGNAYPKGFEFEKAEFFKYTWEGERSNYWYNTLGVKEMCLHVYDTPLEKQRYYQTKINLDDSSLAQMLYIINENINPANTGINLLYFENIPYLAECGVVCFDDSKLTVDVPVISKDEYTKLSYITDQVIKDFILSVLPLLTVHLKNAKTPIPKHLTGVPEQKRYMQAMNCLHMLIVYKAIKKNLILQDADFPCPPMVLVIDK